MTKEIERFYLLDLDRTMYDTKKANEVFYDCIAEIDPAAAVSIKQQATEMDAAFKTFGLLDMTTEAIGPAEAERVAAAFYRQAQKRPLLYEEVPTLLDFVANVPNSAYGILTFGTPKGQRLKLEVTGLSHIPTLVTDQIDKGHLLSSWRRDGVFYLPAELGGFVVRELVFADDKAVSFVGQPDGVIGYHSLKYAKDNEVPSTEAHVTVVDSLIDMIAIERARLIDKA